jgi:hypothetical protein
VILAGFDLGAGTDSSTVDIIAPGKYQWTVVSGNGGDQSLRVGGRTVTNGAIIDLEVGLYPISLGPGVNRGRLDLAVGGPRPDGIFPFFDPRQTYQIVGLR